MLSRQYLFATNSRCMVWWLRTRTLTTHLTCCVAPNSRSQSTLRVNHVMSVRQPLPLLCRFLGRRNDVTLHALMRPAFEKRQGTKSRSVVHRRCGGRYRELTDAHELEAEGFFTAVGLERMPKLD